MQTLHRTLQLKRAGVYSTTINSLIIQWRILPLKINKLFSPLHQPPFLFISLLTLLQHMLFITYIPLTHEMPLLSTWSYTEQITLKLYNKYVYSLRYESTFSVLLWIFSRCTFSNKQKSYIIHIGHHLRYKPYDL